MVREGASERQLARRIRLSAGAGAVVQVLLGFATIYLAPACWTAAVVALRGTRHLDRTDNGAEQWTGAALVASLVPLLVGLGTGPLVLVPAVLSTALFWLAWRSSRQHGTVRRRRWQLERGLRAAPPEQVLRDPGAATSGGQERPDGDVTEG